MTVVRLLRTFHRETRAEYYSGGCGEMKVVGVGISVVNLEMRDKTHLGEGPPH